MNSFLQVQQELKSYDGDTIKIMEVCGSHTASIFKNGIRSLISPKIKLISGPGCPVCVTSTVYIDKLVEYTRNENTCILTFGDMMKVKGNEFSLTEAKARGGNVQILYSPLQALTIAKENSHRNFIFAAVGFETTTPIYALLIQEMERLKLNNLKLLTSIKTMPPALTYICENEKSIDAFLCPGHVSVITGSNIYQGFVKKYQKPFVISGFEGEHILAAIYEIMNQVKKKQFRMKNCYENAVTENGNTKAKELIHHYFESVDDHWRGIGLIKNSGLRLKSEFLSYDAGSYLEDIQGELKTGCRCKDVILGRMNPIDCPLFGKICTPLNAIGPCMVSSEGACGIWYRYREV